VLGVLAAVVGLAALDVASIQALALFGVVIILITRCIDSDEAFGFIEGQLLAMIFGMLIVGAGLETSGAAQLLVDWAEPLLRDLPGWALVGAVYLVSMMLTEVVSNNAVAVIVTPVAIGLAQTMGVDARPLVVAVMFAASASFATPIGYQTNTLVYGPGGYRFTDFLRVGLPLNGLALLTSTLLIPLIWPL
jgi:Di- and tricarboxylate transporters